MASKSKDKGVVIAILLTSTLLTLLGITGILRGAYDLSLAPLPEDVRELYEPEVEVSDAEVQLLEAQLTNPYRRPMGAANIVVSAMVLIGSFMLSWRRSLAQWWIKQAVAAKLIWIAAYTVSLAYHIKLTFPPPSLDHMGEALPEVILGVIAVSSLSAAIHVAAAYRATRPDIRELIEAAARSGGRPGPD
jgi:hypothetical protein